MGDFDERRALVTGAGGGIGRAVAIHLAKGGARVACLDLDEAAAQEVAGEIGPRATAVSADVSDESQVHTAFDTALGASMDSTSSPTTRASRSSSPPRKRVSRSGDGRFASTFPPGPRGDLS